MTQKMLKVFVSVFLIYLAYYLGRMNLGALIPIIREEYGFTNTQLGLVAASMYFAYTLSQIPSGYIVDRIGVRHTIAIGCMLIALGNAAMITWFFPVLIAAQLLNGFGQSTGWSSLVKYAYNYGGNSRKVLGILSSSVPAGTFIAYTLAGSIAESFGLDFAFLIPSAVMLAVALIILMRFPTNGGSGSFWDNFTFLKSKNLLALSFVQLSILSTMNSLFIWLPVLFVDMYAVKTFDAYKLVSIFPLPGIIGGIAGGYLATRWGDKRTIIVNQSILLVLVVAIASLASNITFTIFYALLLVLSIFFRFGSAALFSLGIKSIGLDMAGRVSGFLNFVGSIGSTAVTALIGYIIDNYSLIYVLYLYGAIVAASLILSLFLSEKSPLN